MRVFKPRHLCWRPDIPDFRDFVPSSPEIRHYLPDCKQPFAELPASADMSDYLLSCPGSELAETCPSSIVCTKLVEYFNYRCAGRIEPLCAQYVSRSVNWFSRSDCSGIRGNLKAIRQFGIPPISMSDSSGKSSRCHNDCIPLATEDYRSMHYMRLDYPLESGSPLRTLKAWLASGFPIAFGFSVPSSLGYEGFIDFRPTFDSIQGGHAALLVGFDDRQLAASRGAFRVYCPWGDDWGDQGFGWLPYVFVERRIALDFWTIIKPEWLGAGELFLAST